MTDNTHNEYSDMLESSDDGRRADENDNNNKEDEEDTEDTGRTYLLDIDNTDVYEESGPQRLNRAKKKPEPSPEESKEEEPTTFTLGDEDSPEGEIHRVDSDESINSVDSGADLVGEERITYLLSKPSKDGDVHKPHEMFCEMYNLRKDADGEMQWKETARWIKFEEDVEEEGDRWSKPHVGTLSMKSLYELKQGLNDGCILLDLNKDNLPNIIDFIIDDLVTLGLLEKEHSEKVKDVLSRDHRHQFMHGKVYDANSAEYAPAAVVRKISQIGRKISTTTKLDSLGSEANGEPGMKYIYNEHFAKKIPQGAEAANILIGAVDFLEKPITVFLRLRNAALLGDFTEVPVPTKFIFILLGPESCAKDYHEVGRCIATLMADEIFHCVAYKAENKNDLILGLDGFLTSVTVLPPGEWDPSIRIEPPTSIPSGEDRMKQLMTRSQSSHQLLRNHSVEDGFDEDGDEENQKLAEEKEEEEEDDSLQRTGRLFGGLIRDIKRKVPFYLSDFKDALHLQCVATLFFMYFACLTPIVTFGGLLGAATEDHIAAFESLLTGAIAGITYHLFAGQPLTIIGSTGPVLVFETIVYNFCKDFGYDYLALRFWIGMWITLMLLIIVAFDLSSLVRYITRFTEESFATLIALIFIVEAFKKLFHIKDKYPIDTDPDPWWLPRGGCLCLPEGMKYSDFNTTMSTPSVTSPTTSALTSPTTSPPTSPMTSPASPMATTVAENVTSLLNQMTTEMLTMASPTQDLMTAGIVKRAAEDDLLDLNMTSVAPTANSSINYWNLTKEQCKDLHGHYVGDGCPYYVPDVFFFSCLLFIFTFAMSYSLKGFRNALCFPNKVRVLISDFAVFLSIITMVVVDILVGIDTPKLNVPSSFRPTREDRGWIVSPFKNPWWLILAGILPAFLGTILIFMDQQITAVIVNRKEHLLKKGKGYHLDLFLIALHIAVCSILGIPWFVAATVLSINHVRSLTVESEAAAPGEKLKFLGVREQRVTGVIAFLMVGLSVLATDALRIIPMPVLYGVFLYMGVSSLNGLQLFERILIIFMPKKYQPDYTYLRKVPLMRIHLFTFIQVICLAALWAVKSISSISIIFPLMVLAMCFIRKALDKVFTNHELKWLDDIMPQSQRDKEETKISKKQKKTVYNALKNNAGIEITLPDGKTMILPAEFLKYDPSSNTMKVSASQTEKLTKQSEKKKNLVGRNNKAFDESNI